MKNFRIFLALLILVIVVSLTDIVPPMWSNLIAGAFVAWILYRLITKIWGNKD
tara:strand:- start:161 stop:319 length:159 start_codon:yes stop_codon:yes gene_type:complete